MWKLNRIIAQNLCAFKELDYTLTQGVTTLIFGDNRDNESQRSNGSGKSALLECIAIGITGSPLRKIKNEEIINDSADECYVSLVFSNNSSSEVFAIERTIYRKGASNVHCVIERDGRTVTTDEAVQHSVDGYNKYILEKLGITRDELFNNFVLSKHKYEDFLSASDKEKKEIINRFSNGIVVDEAIAKVEEDIVPVEEGLSNAELELAGLDGRINMLSEQIEHEEESREERTKSKAEKIALIEQTVSEKRAVIRDCKEKLSALEKVKTELTRTDRQVQELENSEQPLHQCLEQVKFLLSTYGTLTDWKGVMSSKQEEIRQVEQKLSGLDVLLQQAGGKVKEHTLTVKALKEEHSQFMECSTKKSEGYKTELSRLESQLNEVNQFGRELRNRRRTLSSAIETLSGKIAGTISCPRCKHEFLVTDRDFDVTEGRKVLEQQQKVLEKVVSDIGETEQQVTVIEQQQTEIQENRRKLNAAHGEWLNKIAATEKELQTATYNLESLQRKERQITDTISALQTETENIRRKMFDEAFEIIDIAYRTNERKTQSLAEEVSAAESSVETLYTTIGELNRCSSSEVIDSLKASLKTYRKKSVETLQQKNSIEQERNRLREQEQRFTQFKSFLANTKIEALSKITNEFLESIGSDLRIRFSGYTVLKTGKIREKISISILRDGIDCGSFGKLSAGESARLQLASILAMQKLVNSNCEADKGLSLIVLDEILSAVDEEGLAKMFDSLNKLGITALVVSHNHISEAYKHTLIIKKENGRSEITQII